MSKFIIQGGQSLEGEVTVGGAKNAALKQMAAALLTDQNVILHNVPRIKDIEVMMQILQKLGADISMNDHTVTICCSQVKSPKPDYQLVKHMRASVVTIGPLVAKYGEAKLPQPGGCLLGSRPIDTHVNALRQLGVEITEKEDYFYFSAAKLKGNKVVLDEMSVTATENVMLAAVLAEGTTEIHLAASEPEIIDLAAMLNKMGAHIKGAGTSVITIKGVKELGGVTHTVVPDRIEAGTFAIAAAVSRGTVLIKNVIADHLNVVLKKLKQANVSLVERSNNILEVKPTTTFKPIQIDTRPYPGFPTDLQAPLSVLLTQATGTSRIFETMYDGRLGYTKELSKMGADIRAVDAHTIIINGPTPLYGKKITSFDIRAGATLIVAALIADGESTIDKVELVDRGYENIENRLRSIGANIKRINS